MSNSAKLLCAGFVALLAAGVALLFGLNSAADPTTSTPRPLAGSEASKSGSAGTSDVAGGAGGAASASPLFPEVKPRPPSQLPSIAADIARPTDDEIEYRPDGVPIAVADLDSLREIAATTDDALRACAAKHGGEAVRGQLIATYVLARKKDETGKYVTVVESTGYEEDGTTFTNAELIECMHKTSSIQKFPPSKSPVAVWARRRITFEAGRLGDNWVFQHGYIR